MVVRMVQLHQYLINPFDYSYFLTLHYVRKIAYPLDCKEE